MRREVTVTDIQSDPLWRDFKVHAATAGLRACWSSPIVGGSSRVLGTFAFYYTEIREPGKTERDIVAACVQLCAIAIEREERVKERQRLAFTDELTGLGNRAAFNKKLEALSIGIKNWGLILVDLDNLKAANDTFGHEAGDQMLRAVSDCLAAVSPENCAFRLGGDEFAVVMSTIHLNGGLAHIAAKILERLAASSHGGLVPRASIGGAEFGRGIKDAAVVKRNADLALYHAKKTGRGRFVPFFEGLAPSSDMRRLDKRMYQLNSFDVDVTYRPIVNLSSGQIVGVQALYRGQPALDAAAAVSASFALIDAITSNMRQREIVGTNLEFVTVDLPLGVFRQAAVLEKCLEIAKLTSPTSCRFYVQVTEAEISGLSNYRLEYERLRSAGLRMALNQFGSGQGSLKDLLALDPEMITIDRSMIRQVGQTARADLIVEGFIAFARKLNVNIVADGVDNREQADRLLVSGFRLGQGPYFNGPVDATSLSEVFTRCPAGVRSSAALATVDPRTIALAPS
jgi:diguanylate cyclase (GGDEF)-like protein